MRLPEDLGLKTEAVFRRNIRRVGDDQIVGCSAGRCEEIAFQKLHGCPERGGVLLCQGKRVMGKIGECDNAIRAGESDRNADAPGTTAQIEHTAERTICDECDHALCEQFCFRTRDQRSCVRMKLVGEEGDGAQNILKRLPLCAAGTQVMKRGKRLFCQLCVRIQPEQQCIFAGQKRKKLSGIIKRIRNAACLQSGSGIPDCITGGQD